MDNMIKDNHVQNAWIKKTDAEGKDCMRMIYGGRNEIRGQRLTRRYMIAGKMESGFCTFT